jgi:hypothetical protein
MSRFAHAALAVLAAGAAAGAAAQSVSLTATLTNAQEDRPGFPPTIPTLVGGAPRPVSSGFATFLIDDARTSMSFSATINNIDFGGQTDDPNDDLVNAHIHAGPTAVPGSNGPVVWGFIGNPFNDTSPTNVVVTPFTTGVGGTVEGTWDAPEGQNTTFAGQLNNILAGASYINFHTVQFPGGEVRGQLISTTPVPEPETYALMLAGLGVLGGWARRRARGASTAA